MKLKHKRAYTLTIIMLCLGGVCLFLGTALRQNIRFFVTPSQIYSENLMHHKHLRLGGVVKENSLYQHHLTSEFIITDGMIDIDVIYVGMLPDLFREGQTVVAEGHFDQENLSKFQAKVILAKHDENYKPPHLRSNNMSSTIQNLQSTLKEIPDGKASQKTREKKADELQSQSKSVD